MPSKRLIYMLDAAPRRRLRCRPFVAPHLNWSTFQPANTEGFGDLLKTKYAEAVEKADRRLIAHLIHAEERADWETVALLAQKPGAIFLLEALETGRLFHAKGNHLRLVPGEDLPVHPVWRQTPEGTWLPDFEPAAGCPATASLHAVSTDPPLYLDLASSRNRLGRLCFAWPDNLACSWLDTESMDTEAVAAFRLRLLKRHPEAAIPDLPTAPSPAEVIVRPTPRLTVWQTNGGGDAPDPGVLADAAKLLIVRLSFVYGTRAIPADHAEGVVHYQEGPRVASAKRDRASEAALLADLIGAGFRPHGGKVAEGFLFTTDADAYELGDGSWQRVLSERFPQWQAEGWEIRLPASINLRAVDENALEASLTPDEESDYAYRAEVIAGERRHSLLPALVAYLKANKRRTRSEFIAQMKGRAFWWCPEVLVTTTPSVFLLSGERLAEIAETVYELGESKAMRNKEAVRLDRFRAGEVAADLQLKGAPEVFSLETLRRFWQDRPDRIDFTPPDNLPPSAEILRPYQRESLGWFSFLRQSGTHGILADDMGLGKTLQTLVYLDHEKACGRLQRPVLLIVPTSVLSNWGREATERTPGLRVRLHHGSTRAPLTAESLERTDVVITSYGLLVQEAAVLAALEWSHLILDEAQNIKNREARRTQAARAIPAERRLCLSGTPLENHLGELWSLFNFLMPGFLGSYGTFETRFRKPIEDAEDPAEARQRSAALARRIRPFILRRTKEQVARDLPERSETTHRLPLEPAQAALYERHRTNMLESVRERIRESGLNNSRMHILEALLRLRQICCDPRLLGEEGESAAGASAKLDRLLDMLEELRAEGHRTLVFSQFVGMLDLIAAACAERGWETLLFTGATTDRQAIIDTFNKGSCPILLISLKAGGAGLNLTGADTVIHYDPWWNPATEQQATDRAHRIGQTRPVFIHRLIAESTVEERILALHEQKRALVEDLLAGLPSDHIELDESILEAFE
ncbi:MAG: DEAD/DEAH box helicase [Opitutales bacterium]|nr:DEAD/DEAH box helicase [Opitutales bacterium]